MEIIIGVGGAVTLIGGLIVVINFVSNRPKREEVQNMIDRSIASLHEGMARVESSQKDVIKTITELGQNIGKLCPYSEIHKG